MPLVANSQNGSYTLGARSTAMGSASLTIQDEWAVFNNAAGLADVEASAGLISYQNRYNISALNVLGAGYVHNLPFGTAGISAFRFGDDLFNEQKLGLSFGNKLGIVSLGATLNYAQINIEGFGRRGFAFFDFGGIVEFSKALFFSANISNINQARVSKAENDRQPTVMRAGISYRPIDGLMLNGEIEKDLDFKEVFKAGFEYQFYRQFLVRTGFKTEPFNASFGLGFRPGKFDVGYAYSNDPNIGSSHELSVALIFNQTE
ncbi:MAG: hypothetical protein RJQ09_03525 [Cyclobacteriaceae bacterium]